MTYSPGAITPARTTGETITTRAERQYAEGYAEGLAEGRAEVVLFGQLTDKFGPLPAWVDESIATANLPTLRQWTKNVLRAENLDQVFA